MEGEMLTGWKPVFFYLRVVGIPKIFVFTVFIILESKYVLDLNAFTFCWFDPKQVWDLNKCSEER